MGKTGSIDINGQDNPTFQNDVTLPNSQKSKLGLPLPEYDKGEIALNNLDPELVATPERPKWDNQLEFLMSCISMSVGLGNIWRFPVTAYENGGGAFLIPYLIVLVFVGRPTYFLELCIGQFCSQSQVKIWRCNPLFKGVGYSSMVATLCVMSYYCSIMAVTTFYFFASFAKTLPWDVCDEKWVEQGLISTCNRTILNNDSSSPAIPELYFVHEVLKESEDINDGIGIPDWRLTLCLLFSWLVIYLSLIKGIQSSGKVAYFTALFPYVVLITLLIRGATLDGAWKGIKYFLTPKWSELYNPKVWYAAVSQCFLSLNTGFGSVIMFASYNPFKHNIYRDAVILSFMDTFTSLLAGITVFSVLGYLSVLTGKEVPDILGSGGTGITFVAYPAALAQFPVSQLFSVLFFLMLFTLGIGSATASAAAIITLFSDQFPNVKRWKITTFLCLFGFVVGLIYVTPGGQFILSLVDFYGAAFVIFISAVLEVVGIIWFYGLSNFIKDIEFMLDIKVGWYWKICWGLVIPVGLSLILVYSLVTTAELTYNGVSFPTSAIVSGWLLAVLCMLPLPVCAFLAIRKSSAPNFVDKLKESWQPVARWGPMDPKIREEWVAYKKLN